MSPGPARGRSASDAPRLPFEFWRVLHAEYGIVVYPSALTEDIDVQGLGTDVTYTEAYGGHIGIHEGERP